jgi:hypothetical protein
MLLHEDTNLHTVCVFQETILELKWEPLDHPPYKPDMTPSNFHLFSSTTERKIFLPWSIGWMYELHLWLRHQPNMRYSYDYDSSQTWDRVQLKCDGTRWRTGGEVKGKLANGVGSHYPSHYIGTWCIQHYYLRCAHLGCQYSIELTPSPI